MTPLLVGGSNTNRLNKAMGVNTSSLANGGWQSIRTAMETLLP